MTPTNPDAPEAKQDAPTPQRIVGAYPAFPFWAYHINRNPEATEPGYWVRLTAPASPGRDWPLHYWLPDQPGKPTIHYPFTATPATGTDTPDDAEAKRRAQWLRDHKAPHDWVVLTTSEVATIKRELASANADRNALRGQVEEDDKAVVDWLEIHVRWNDHKNQAAVYFAIPTVPFVTLREAVAAARSASPEDQP